ncbi:Nn.00g107260.m01.CDS01 [Neocucurbitaria sp. VM-36]
MASLDDVPDELLLQVAEHLGHSDRRPRDRNNDLCSLALVARKYRGVAREILYTSLCVDKPHSYNERGEIYQNTTLNAVGNTLVQRCVAYRDEDGPTRVVRLVRTLLEQPNLADMVCCLDITVIYRRKTHDSRCANFNRGDLCRCGWQDFVNLCKASIFRINHPALSKTAKRHWIRAIHMGQEIAVLGVLLASIPKLRGLDLSFYSPIPKTLRSVDGEFYLGNEDYNSNSDVGGHYFDEKAISNVPTWLNSDRDISPAQFPMLKDLIVEMDLGTLSGRHNTQNYLHDVLLRLPKLRYLQFRLVPRTYMDEYRNYSYIDMFESSYDQILGQLACHDTLETLIIDVAELYEQNAVPSRCAILFEYLEVMGSLINYPSLRRIVAPQEAIFSSMTGGFDICVFPKSIETIEIIDSTRIANHFALYLIEQKSDFPNLKTIVLWSFRKAHLAPDIQLGAHRPQQRLCDCLDSIGYFFPDDRVNCGDGGWHELFEEYGNMVNWVWKCDRDIPESVWDELTETGIDVLWKTAKEHEWRDEI